MHSIVPLKCLGVPPDVDELVEEKEVWVSLLRLVPLLPGPR